MGLKMCRLGNSEYIFYNTAILLTNFISSSAYMSAWMRKESINLKWMNWFNIENISLFRSNWQKDRQMKNKINENNLSMYKNKIFYLSFLFKEISKQCKSIILSSMNINNYNSTTHQYSVHCHPTYNPMSMSSDNFQQGSGMFVHILLGCPSIHWHLKKEKTMGFYFRSFLHIKYFVISSVKMILTLFVYDCLESIQHCFLKFGSRCMVVSSKQRHMKSVHAPEAISVISGKFW